MIKRFVFPLFASFALVHVLGSIIIEIFKFLHGLRPSPDNGSLVITLRFTVPYLIVAGFSFLKYKKDKVCLAAILLGPILLTAIIIPLFFLFVEIIGGGPPVD